MKRMLILVLSVWMLGCVDDSLQVQTSFPFTVSADPLPSPASVKTDVSTILMVLPERTSTLDAYTIRVVSPTLPAPTVRVDGRALVLGVSTPLLRLNPRLSVESLTAGSYTLTIEISNREGTRQSLALNVQAQ